ncbi:MAG: DUF177 domain-containing protein [Thermodesulfovibrionales bacterium]|nr:DUF177 domain-containing protein [Thermodesulfovibrionales bacterium]
MKIVINEIPLEGLDINLLEQRNFESLRTISPYELTVRILKKGETVSLSGRVKCKIELQCSRCLGSCIHEVNSPLEIELRPLREINEEGYYELQKSELDVGFYTGGVIDLDDIVSEQLFLNIPMKPLCSTECKGLCPKCGADLNKNVCTCKSKELDERLKVLAKLILKER